MCFTYYLNFQLYKQIKYNKNTYIVFVKYKHTKLENKTKK